MFPQDEDSKNLIDLTSAQQNQLATKCINAGISQEITKILRGSMSYWEVPADISECLNTTIRHRRDKIAVGGRRGRRGVQKVTNMIMKCSTLHRWAGIAQFV
jgi:hypothetical protein